MVELLVTLTVPPLVGVIIYYALKRMWEREENQPIAGHDELITVPAPTIAPSETNIAIHDKQSTKPAG
jgi:hypothetical protein